jgi:hypothetical protein
MIRVVVQVRTGAAHFNVAVQAENIQRAVNFVAGRYRDGDVRVKFPIEPERFFVKDLGELIGHEQLEMAAS